MPAVIVPDFLIGPSAGMIDQSRSVDGGDGIGDAPGVKLPPGFVEGNPRVDADRVFQMCEHLCKLHFELPTAFGVLTTEKTIAMIFQMNTGDGENSMKEDVLALASANHILPDKHAQSVAMIVPRRGSILICLRSMLNPMLFISSIS